jgi:Protein of unknown function (DUF2958)
MELITQDIRRELEANGRKNAEHIACDGSTEDFKPVLKLFNPCGPGTWLITELDNDGDTMFGLCDLGWGTPELGSVSLQEVSTMKLPFGLSIERDVLFKARYTLCEYAERARQAGYIEA